MSQKTKSQQKSPRPALYMRTSLSGAENRLSLSEQRHILEEYLKRLVDGGQPDDDAGKQRISALQ